MRPLPRTESSRAASRQLHTLGPVAAVVERSVQQVRQLSLAQQLQLSPLGSTHLQREHLHPTTTDDAPWSASGGVRGFQSQCSFTGH